jgi:succinate-semialdehyde dehydrogenase/glutarate-semialdehyde dehydrogenase
VNNGQSCVAAKRFIVHDAIGDEFERRFAARMRALRVGDPMDPAAELGPLATEEIIDRLADQVERTVSGGARVVVGGHRMARPGYFYEPTVLAGIPERSPARGEEFFGPVALLFRVPSFEAAIALANETPFGLGSSLWSTDPREQEAFVRDIQSGMAFVNALVTSDPAMPAGGVKRSGYGRELGEFGIHEFVNAKTVWMQPAPGASEAVHVE